MKGVQSDLGKAIRYLRLRPGAGLLLARCLAHNLAGRARTLVGARGARCNLCGWRGARFEAYPDGARLKYGQRCPRCRSSPRYRLFAAYLTSRPEFAERTAVLMEFAPEPSMRAFLSARFAGTYVTVDLNSPLAAVHTDLMKPGLKPACADLILCSHVLEHLPDDRLGLRELRGLLKPGAWGILQVPMVAGLPATIEYGRPEPKEHDHFRRYGEDFVERLTESGFRVEQLRASSFLAPEETRELALPDFPILKAVRPA